MQLPPLVLLGSLLVYGLGGCQAGRVRPTGQDAAQGFDVTTTVVYLSRHYEKAIGAEYAGNPPLTPLGESRAQALAELLDTMQFAAVLSTPFARTEQTAAPLAARLGMRVDTYSPSSSTSALMDSLVRVHRGKKLLIVGHSNTVPRMLNALVQTPHYAEFSEQDYGMLYRVELADGRLPKLDSVIVGSL